MKKYIYTKDAQTVTVETDGLGGINNFMVTGLIGSNFGDIVAAGFNLKMGDSVTIAEMLNIAKACKCKVTCYEGNRLLVNESADYTEGAAQPTGIISGLSLGVAYDEKSYNAIVPPAYVEQYPFSESEPSMPWLVAKFQKVMNSEPDGEAPNMEVRMWADDYQLSFGGTSSNVGTVSEDGKVLTTNKANSSLMFEVKKDLGVLDPKKVTWFRIRIDFEGRAYFAETYVTPDSI